MRLQLSGSAWQANHLRCFKIEAIFAISISFLMASLPKHILGPLSLTISSLAQLTPLAVLGTLAQYRILAQRSGSLARSSTIVKVAASCTAEVTLLLQLETLPKFPISTLWHSKSRCQNLIYRQQWYTILKTWRERTARDHISRYLVSSSQNSAVTQ